MELYKSLKPYRSKPSKAEIPYIEFGKVELDWYQLIEELNKGYAFHYPSSDGSRDKDKILGTQVVFVDIDDMALDVPPLQFARALPYPPNIYYPSASDTGDNSKRRFRLVWALDRFVDADEFEQVYSAIVRLNNLPIKREVGSGVDVCSINQLYFGCISRGVIYRVQCNKLKVDSLPVVDSLFVKTEKRTEVEVQHIDPHFANEYLSTDSKVFFKRYYVYQKLYFDKVKRGELILDKSGAFYRPNTADGIYFEFPHKWKDGQYERRADGEMRRKNLYTTAQMMKYNYPKIAPNELLYCLAYVAEYGYVFDYDLTKGEVVAIAERALEREFDYRPLMEPRTRNGKKLKKQYHSFVLNMSYFNNLGITDYRVAINMVMRHLKATCDTRTGNEDTTCDIRHKYDSSHIDLKHYISNNDSLYITPPHYNGLSQAEGKTMEMLLDGKSQGEIAKELKVDRRTVCRYVKKLDGTYIKGEGSTSKKTWVRIEREENQKERGEDGMPSTEKEEVYVVGGTPYNREYSDGTTDEYWRMVRRYERQHKEDWDDDDGYFDENDEKEGLLSEISS